MKIRICLKDGNHIDLDTPDDFQFGFFVATIRDTGRFLHPGIYVPHESIMSIFRIDESGKQMPVTVGSVH